MNYKLLIGIPVAMLAVVILIESPDYWWILLAAPIAFIKWQMRSIHKSAGNSMYDEAYERIHASPPNHENPITLIEVSDSKK